MDEIRVQLDIGAIMPERAYDEDAGLDLKTPVDFVITQYGKALINTGVHVEIPKGFAGFLKSKSGLNCKNDITSDGTIDAGYTGSIKVKLYNHGGRMKFFKRGDKISQLVIQKVELPKPVQVDKIQGGDRGDGGFGSTGV